MLPDRQGSDFKVLFQRLATAGAGRPVDDSGFPQGPWTPDLLAEAISHIDANQSGIELRTVQLWFQDNDKGISADNIRWLARVFGCDDPDATSAWQAELSASQSRLIAKRRQERQTAGAPPQMVEGAELESVRNGPPVSFNRVAPQQTFNGLMQPFDLPRISEAIFARASPLDLPATVFAGAVALGFFSYFLGIHSVTYERVDGVAKQVGFLWAPNWTFLFMVFMPLFFAFVVELLDFWKSEGRTRILTISGDRKGDIGWAQRVAASVYTFWAAFLICLGFAGLFQWISVRLIPLLQGRSNYAIDWGSLAIVRPDVISVSQAIAFTGFAYLYMCLCFYLFFVGLILLFTVVHDLWKMEHQSSLGNESPRPGDHTVRHRIMRGIFRCSVSGILVAVCMKIQSLYLTTDAGGILDWVSRDASSVFSGQNIAGERSIPGTPTHYTSLVVALVTLAVFLYGFIRLGLGNRFNVTIGKMAAAVMFLGTAYLLIGAFTGFSILLGTAILLAVYGLFDPSFGARKTSGPGGH